MSLVSITGNDEIEQAVTEALDALALEDLFRDRVVAVKPNDTWSSRRDVGAVTQPDTLAATLNWLQEYRPAQVLVVGGAGDGETADAFAESGMMDVVETQGVELVDLNRPPFDTVSLEYGPEKEVIVNRRVHDLEVVVSLAQIKLHSCTEVTLALKNVAMGWPAADHYGHPRLKLSHSNGPMSDFIVGMAKRFPIHVAINVGHPAMVDHGPIGGRTVETGLVLASRDPVAADALGARLLGFDPLAVRHIREAAAQGLGQADVAGITTVGLSLGEALVRFERAVAGQV
jgi:uncharacterized protein (DUF362 family)